MLCSREVQVLPAVSFSEEIHSVGSEANKVHISLGLPSGRALVGIAPDPGRGLIRTLGDHRVYRSVVRVIEVVNHCRLEAPILREGYEILLSRDSLAIPVRKPFALGPCS